MFTGIIEGTAPVKTISDQPGGKQLQIGFKDFVKGVAIGDSIAINGVCLTVANLNNSLVSFDVITETLTKTTLGQLKQGSLVNIERSLKVGGSLDGHFVQGHVDAAGEITQKIDTPQEYKLWIHAGELMQYITSRGSIAVNGVSLTIAETKDDTFAVALIPTTLALTNLGQLEPNDKVNIETDILARQAVEWIKKYSHKK